MGALACLAIIADLLYCEAVTIGDAIEQAIGFTEGSLIAGSVARGRLASVAVISCLAVRLERAVIQLQRAASRFRHHLSPLAYQLDRTLDTSRKLRGQWQVAAEHLP